MFKFISQIILVGMFFGFITSSITMLFGFAAYYAVEALEIVLSMYFLTYVAWGALAIGVFVTLSWYIYILAIARKYFLRIVDQFVDDLKQVVKK